MIDHEPAETAWRAHSALMSWTSNADAKASFALTLESAVVAGVVSLTAEKRRLHDLHGVPQAAFWLGMGLLLAGILAAVAGVIPRTRWWSRRKGLKTEASTNAIFFGHLKHRSPTQIEATLKSNDVLPMLTKQLASMSTIAWRKYVYVQLSFVLAVAGVAVMLTLFFCL